MGRGRCKTSSCASIAARRSSSSGANGKRKKLGSRSRSRNKSRRRKRSRSRRRRSKSTSSSESRSAKKKKKNSSRRKTKRPKSRRRRSSSASRAAAVSVGVKLFVGRLPEEVTSEQLREAFEHYGEVLEVFLIDSKASGAAMLGCAFVRMANLEQAQRALHEFPGNGLLAALQVALAKGETERLGFHKLEDSSKEARPKLSEAQLSCAYLFTLPELADLIKAGQRRGGEAFKQKWRSFCEWARRGTNDPSKHEHRSLVHFIVTAAYEYGQESWFRSRFEKLSPPPLPAPAMPRPPGAPSGSPMAWPGMPPWPGQGMPPMPMPPMPGAPLPGSAMAWPGMPPPWAGPWSAPPQPGQPTPHGQPWRPPDQDLGGLGLILPKRRQRSLSQEASEAEDEDQEEDEEEDDDDESKPASKSSGFSGRSTDRVRAAAATKASTAMAAKSRRIQDNVDAVSTCSGSEDEDAEIDAK